MQKHNNAIKCSSTWSLVLLGARNLTCGVYETVSLVYFFWEVVPFECLIILFYVCFLNQSDVSDTGY